MKKILKVLGIIVLLLIVVVAGIAAYVKLALPKVGAAPDLQVERTPVRIERGKYLANAVMGCNDCHTERDWTKYAGPVNPDSTGSGSTLFDKKLGLPGTFHSKNITPYHLGDWTDGEIFRAITTGVSKDGHALFPLMPYKNYGRLDKEDIYSVIAYLRTLPSIKKDIAPSQADFPMNFIINTIPGEPAFSNRPDPTNTVAYGKYLVTAAGCMDCHTKSDKGQIIEGTEFGGGSAFELPFGTVNSSNITPHETGIKNWDKARFIGRFKMYSAPGYTAPTVTADDFNTPMAWTYYAHMTEEDLGAIYDYLRTAKPVNNTVTKFVKKGTNQSEQPR